MSCNHEITKATRRIISNGTEIVSLQCQRCGSGKAAFKGSYNIRALPEFDPSIRERYDQQRKVEWAESQTKRIYENATRTGDWWNRYKTYLDSDNWREVRFRVCKRDQWCQKCFEKAAVQAHHLTYETFNKHGFSFPAECVGVCFDCHASLHLKDEA